MLSFSTSKANISWLQILSLSLGFFLLRGLSFAFINHSLLANTLSFLLLLGFILIYLKNKNLAWLILLSEYLLGGAGHFFEFSGLSLRTSLTLIFLILYLSEFLFYKKYKNFKIDKKILFSLITFYCFLFLATFLGIKAGHELKYIYQDLIPFAFLILFIPASEFLKPEKNKTFLKNLIIAFLLSSAVWALLNFFLFVSETTIIHQAYYNWLRDFALAKITLVTPFYWRVVFPEQILIIPFFFLAANFYLIKKEKIYFLILVFLNLILALNVSRAYFLSLIFGFLFLFSRDKFKPCLKLAFYNLLIFICLFVGLNLASSQGQDSGLAILGLRLNGLQEPSSDQSATNRLELLKPIKKLIKENPVLGSGLGQNLELINAQGNLQNTRYFDWGYFEIWIKWGIFGVLSFLTFFFLLTKKVWQKIKKEPAYLGLFSSLLALLLLNLTVSALFHVLIIVYLALSLALLLRDNQ
ncbi:O-antigen ligase family protein [Candidatus Nomurabacteria bacterium]|nr:O-antigen ligase family protein [Candidatus Nomurabacteria bacterium]